MEPAVVVRIHPGQFLVMHRSLTTSISRSPFGSWTLGAVFVLALAAPGEGWAQPVETIPSVGSAADSGASVLLRPASDSADLQRDARSAQARFERTRVRHLPTTRRGMGGYCDERIGRMCIRHGRSDDWTPPPEAREIREARQELLDTLADLAGGIPGDDWILGQRVRYLGEADRWDEGVELARECGGATAWWCSALTGYALHENERFVEAEDEFREALQAMPPGVREEWDDPSVLLDRTGRSYLDDGEGEVRERRDRLWALANPLYLVEGNDRKTEHFARHTLARIHDRARNPYAMAWGDDLAQVLIRYGPEAGFERHETRPGQVPMGPPSVLGRFEPGSRRIVPLGSYLESPAEIPKGEWTLDERRARARYAPAYSPRIRTLEGQQARFRRGDSLMVVMGYRLPEPEEDEAPRPPIESLETGLFLVHPSGEVVAENSGPDRAEGVFSLRAPVGEYVVSAEALDREEKRAWRLRHGLSQSELPRDVAGVSDLLLLRSWDDDEESPSSLEDAMERVLPAARITEGGSAALAWEVYNVSPGDGPLGFRIRIREESPGFLRRMGEWLRLVTPRRPTEVSWQEEEDDGQIAFRTVDLDLSDLSPGTYELELSMDLPGRDAAEVSRTLEVAEGNEG